MNISFFDIENSERPIFTSAIHGHTLSFYRESLTKGNIAIVQDADALYIRSFSILTKDILDQLSKLKFITTRSTGYDNIDVAYCREKGIIVCHVPIYATNTVAEHTFALLLALSHYLFKAQQQVKQGVVDAESLRGFEITGKTLGVVGLGNIGSRVVEIAKGFGMNILVTTKHPHPSRAKKHGVTFVEFPTLLGRSDIVSFHVPLTNETRHMINKKTITLMKKGSILINTSRGPIVETEALVFALKRGILAGSGLDVLENEGIFKNIHRTKGKSDWNRVLLSQENVIITPHNAYNSRESIERILKISADNIFAFLKGKPINRVC